MMRTFLIVITLVLLSGCGDRTATLVDVKDWIGLVFIAMWFWLWFILTELRDIKKVLDKILAALERNQK
jgi:uncharacterized membrane protein YkvI